MHYWTILRASIRSQLQYPLSFTLLAIAHLISTVTPILGISVLFHRFAQIEGWALCEIGLIYGIAQTGFAIAEMAGQGFETFSQLLKRGEFDRLLLRPLSPLLQISAGGLQLMRIARLLPSLSILIWSCAILHVGVLGPLLCVMGTAALFYGLFIIQATLSFWSTETLELMSIATYGGLQLGQYPMMIFSSSLRTIFTFVIPITCVIYYPAATLLNRERAFWGLPLVGVLFLGFASLFWRWGLHHHRSTGS